MKYENFLQQTLIIILGEKGEYLDKRVFKWKVTWGL